jgi:hypothetical protein
LSHQGFIDGAVVLRWCVDVVTFVTGAREASGCPLPGRRTTPEKVGLPAGAPKFSPTAHHRGQIAGRSPPVELPEMKAQCCLMEEQDRPREALLLRSEGGGGGVLLGGPGSRVESNKGRASHCSALPGEFPSLVSMHLLIQIAEVCYPAPCRPDHRNPRSWMPLAGVIIIMCFRV